MKIVEITCKDCGAKFESIEAFPKEMISCISCEGKDLEFVTTDKEFEGCGGSCDSCSSCENE